LIRAWFRSAANPLICYYSRRGFGWVAYSEPVPLLRHDVVDWEPVDQIEARAIPLSRVKRAYRKPMVVLGLPDGPTSKAGPTPHVMSAG
jgi:hypothetical protein